MFQYFDHSLTQVKISLSSNWANSINKSGFSLKSSSELLDCKNILKDVFNQIRVVTVDKIQNVVSNFYNIALSEMLSQRRSRPLARPRQIAMFLCKELTSYSYPEIGRAFGGKDHTTVIHAVKKIESMLEIDPKLKKQFFELKEIIFIL